jgi:hypothetical protein
MKDDLKAAQKKLDYCEKWLPALVSFMTEWMKNFRIFDGVTYENQLPVKVVHYLKLPSQYGEECVICKANFRFKYPVHQLFCGHCFHINCLAPVLRKRPPIECPICKMVALQYCGPHLK